GGGQHVGRCRLRLRAQSCLCPRGAGRALVHAGHDRAADGEVAERALSPPDEAALAQGLWPLRPTLASGMHELTVQAPPELRGGGPELLATMPGTVADRADLPMFASGEPASGGRRLRRSALPAKSPCFSIKPPLESQVDGAELCRFGLKDRGSL